MKNNKVNVEPTKTLVYVDGYWVDKRYNNRWTVATTDKRTAQRMRDSLIECYNCTDCVSCTWCNNCVNCWHCHECSNQTDIEFVKLKV